MKHSPIRDRIIETAATLFYQNGYNSTGINEIIQKAEIAKATLYSHFRSKEEICIAYLRFKDGQLINDLNAFTSSHPQGKERIISLFDFLEKFYETSDFNGCWCIKTVAEIPKDNETIRLEIQKQKNNLIGLISDLVANNLHELTQEEQQSIARKIYLMYESAVSESHLHQNKWPIKECKDLCQTLLG